MNVPKKILHTFLFILILSIILLPQSTLAAGKMPAGSKIAHLNVEDKKVAEIYNILEEETLNWKQLEPLELEGDFETIALPRDAFTFEIEETIAELSEKTKRSFKNFFRKQKNVQVPLHVTIDESHPVLEDIKNRDYINYDELYEKLTMTASQLGNYKLSLSYIEDKQLPLETIVELTMDIPKLSHTSLDYIIDELQEEILLPEQLFSFLNSVETPEKLLNSEKETSFLGSALYELFLQGNFTIVERHPQQLLPNYGEPGIHAQVDQAEKKDLVVQNDNPTAYLLDLERKKNKLHVKLKGLDQQITYQYEQKDEEEIEPRTIYRYSEDMTPGEHHVIQAGEKGLRIDLYRNKYEDHALVTSELVSKEIYLPIPRILLVATTDPEIEAENDIVLEGEEEIDEVDEWIERYPYLGDLLEDELAGTEELEQIRLIEEAQRQYEEYLTELFLSLAKNIETDDAGEEIEKLLDQIENMNEQLQQLDEKMSKVIDQLIEREVIDEEIFKNFKEGE